MKMVSRACADGGKDPLHAKHSVVLAIVALTVSASVVEDDDEDNKEPDISEMKDRGAPGTVHGSCNASSQFGRKRL